MKMHSREHRKVYLCCLNNFSRADKKWSLMTYFSQTRGIIPDKYQRVTGGVATPQDAADFHYVAQPFETPRRFHICGLAKLCVQVKGK